MSVTAEQLADHHFFNAKSGRKPDQRESDLIDTIQDRVKSLAHVIFLDVPENRNRSLAINALEEASMRAVRAIFEPRLDVNA